MISNFLVYFQSIFPDFEQRQGERETSQPHATRRCRGLHRPPNGLTEPERRVCEPHKQKQISSSLRWLTPRISLEKQHRGQTIFALQVQNSSETVSHVSCWGKTRGTFDRSSGQVVTVFSRTSLEIALGDQATQPLQFTEAGDQVEW